MKTEPPRGKKEIRESLEGLGAKALPVGGSIGESVTGEVQRTQTMGQRASRSTGASNARQLPLQKVAALLQPIVVRGLQWTGAELGGGLTGHAQQPVEGGSALGLHTAGEGGKAME